LDQGWKILDLVQRCTLHEGPTPKYYLWVQATNNNFLKWKKNNNHNYSLRMMNINFWGFTSYPLKKNFILKTPQWLSYKKEEIPTFWTYTSESTIAIGSLSFKDQELTIQVILKFKTRNQTWDMHPSMVRHIDSCILRYLH